MKWSDTSLGPPRSSNIPFFAVCLPPARLTPCLWNIQVEMDSRAQTGMTALHFAARYGHNSCVMALVRSFGADVDSVDEYGFKAVDYAREENHLDVVDILEDRY